MANQNPLSLVEAVKDAANSGLDIGGVRQHAALVPFGGKQPKVVFMPQYQGYVHLMCYGPDATANSVTAEVVRECDEFTYSVNETGEHLYYNKNMKPGRKNSPIVGAFAIAYLKSGTSKVKVMTFEELEDIRKRSPSVKKNKSSPWDTDREAMYRKCPVRALRNLVPMGNPTIEKILEADMAFHGETEVAEAVVIDNEMLPAKPAVKPVEVKEKPKRRATKQAAPPPPQTPPSPPPPQDPAPVEVTNQDADDPPPHEQHIDVEKVKVWGEIQNAKSRMTDEASRIIETHCAPVTFESSIQELRNHLFDCKNIMGEG